MAHAGSDALGPQHSIWAGIWERIAARPRRLLILDYDGTLAVLRAERMRALPSPAMLAVLRTLQDTPGTQVAIVSGRPLDELEVLLPGLRVRLVGEHGWEERAPGLGRVLHVVEPLVAHHLDRAANLVPSGCTAVERKRCSIALHTRTLRADAAAAEAAASRLWGPLQLPGLLRLERNRGGLELRAISRDKGVATRELLRGLPPDSLVLALGDDASDEAMFHAVRGHGLGVRVGGEGGDTEAGAWLPSVAAVEEFLQAFARVTRGAGADA